MELIEFHQLLPSACAIAISNNTEQKMHLARFPTFVPRNQSSFEARGVRVSEPKMLACWENGEPASAMSKCLSPILVLANSVVTAASGLPFNDSRANLASGPDLCLLAPLYFTK